MSCPLLLASRRDVAFMAEPPELTAWRDGPPGHRPARTTVPVPVSAQEHAAAGLLPPSGGSIRRVEPRLDLLTRAITRMTQNEGTSLLARASHEGTRVRLVGADGTEEPFDLAPDEVLGFLAGLFSCVPRHVCDSGVDDPGHVLLSLSPDSGRHQYRARLSASVGSPPANIVDSGITPDLLGHLLDTLDRGAGLLLVSGTARSGRSTTLELLGATLATRGMIGGRIGPAPQGADPHVWLADSGTAWPFLDDPLVDRTDFVIMDPDDGAIDLALAARLAAAGRFVVAAAPASDPRLLGPTIAGELASLAAPVPPICVLGQALVRTVCKKCLTWVTFPPERTRRLGFHEPDEAAFDRHGGLTAPHGGGCAACAGTGSGGMVGVFEFVNADAATHPLPRMREDAWSKVLQGLAVADDVAALPGLHLGMRPLRDVMVHGAPAPERRHPPRAHAAASAPVEPVKDPAAPPVDEGPPSMSANSKEGVGETSPNPSPSGEPSRSAADGDLFARCLLDARSGQANTATLDKIVSTVEERARSSAPIAALLAPSKGFHLGRHAVNTALLGLRIGAALDGDLDPSLLTRLGILHDVGLVQAGVDPTAEMPPTVSKESLDHTGSRLKPGPVLRSLRLDPEPLEKLILRVQKLHSSTPTAMAADSPTDRYVQVVALASLIEMHSREPGRDRPADVHDATATVMRRYQGCFAPDLFGALLAAVPIFPIGCFVELSSGDLAKVVSLNEANHFRPRVEIRIVGGGRGLPERRVVDLARAPFLHIRQRVAGANPGAMIRA
ncbi:MAG: hypothetical protein ACE5HU_02710 [Acidobacteriota bacterium]